MKRALLISGFFFLAGICSAQEVVVTITDHASGVPVADAVIRIAGSNKDANVYVSDENGKIAVSEKPPFKLHCTHLNYQNHDQHIRKAGECSIRLLPQDHVLDDVVITGQYQPQSARNSVYTVKTINETTIKKQGAVQLAEVLSRQLNIRITPDLAIGSSTMTFQGIPAKNVKILIDGIPLVNRNGNGNGADLSQINVTNVERIEIVEGPMAVNYGANALAGVVNIITKKGAGKGSYLSVDLLAETIEDKFSPDDGKGNINLAGGISLNKALNSSINASRTRFGGYKGDKTGRAYLWHPKTQHLLDAGLTYAGKRFSIGYKFDGFHELINNYDSLRYETHQATGATRPYGVDRQYTSVRLGHQMDLNGEFTDFLRYNFVGSYSDFSRRVRTFKNYLDNGEEIDYTSNGSSDTTTYTVFLTRGTIQHVNSSKLINYQWGFETNFESTEGGRIKDQTVQSMQDYATFLSLEIGSNSNLKVRPGFRWSYNSKYHGNLVPSLNVKYNATDAINISGAYGKGYRAPGLRELYFEFVDSNHNIIGNEDLKPEYSNHFDFGISHDVRRPGNKIIKSELAFFYNDITDLITIAYDPSDPARASYFNLGRLQTIGGNINETVDLGRLSAGIGVGLIGKKENEDGEDLSDDFLFTPEVSADLSYRERWSGINFNLFYKFNGERPRYYLDENDELAIGTMDSYSLLDFTLNRILLKNITLTLGAKNILNVTSINNSTGSTGGVHGGSSSSANIGYGRTFFARLSFSLKSKK
ncbi:MAG: TonB-dependent receptor [Cytophagales bacterium]|nr:TonB-dependent receptor [Cytophagales bacterium]